MVNPIIDFVNMRRPRPCSMLRRKIFRLLKRVYGRYRSILAHEGEYLLGLNRDVLSHFFSTPVVCYEGGIFNAEKAF